MVERHCAKPRVAPTPHRYHCQHCHRRLQTRGLDLLYEVMRRCKNNILEILGCATCSIFLIKLRSVDQQTRGGWHLAIFSPDHVQDCWFNRHYDFVFFFKLPTLIIAHSIIYFRFSHLRWGKSSLSLPIILAGSRQVLMASRKKAVDVPTFPLNIDLFTG